MNTAIASLILAASVHFKRVCLLPCPFIGFIEEEWRPIPHYRGIAEASNLGRIRTLDRIGKKGFKTKGKVLNQRYSRDGYLLCNIRTLNDRKTLSVHRLVALTFISEIEGKPQVNHINGKKDDNKVWNLEWMDVKGQQEHALKLGLLHDGEKNSNSKLTADNVRKILKDDRVSWKIAKDYGVSGSLIRMIKRREVWRNLDNME